MTPTLTCPNCQHRFRLPTEHAGAKIPCPRCEHLVGLPAEAGPADVMEAPTTLRPPRPPEEDVVEADEDAPPIRRKGFHSCPRCGAGGAERVLFTLWGSFYGPALFNHVRCPECKYAYNGRTGRSNLLPAIVFVTIPALLIAGVLTFLGVLLYQHMF